MALSFLRLRRAVAISSSLLKQRHFTPAYAISSSPPLPLSTPLVPSPRIGSPSLRPHCAIQSLSFQSSTLSSVRRSDGDESKISPDDILFEGCDYNHWLITMDFPKDPAPTPEEMVETYVQTLAKVVGSVEEAKKKMYACSTTTYHGFQAVMTEEMSEKFRGLPGVVFILPDSYIDPVNKEYGGDKYDNGVITPRPPPVQYGRQGRYGDRNRNYDRPRGYMNQGNPPYDRREPMQGDGRNYVPQQHSNMASQDRRGYGSPGGGNFSSPMERRDFGQGERRDYVQAGGRDSYQGPPGGGNFAPSLERRDFGQGERRDYVQAGGRDSYQGPPGGGNFAPSLERRDFGQGERRDYVQAGGRANAPGGRDNYQGEMRDPMPSYQRDFNQGEQRSFVPQERRDFSQEQQVSGGSDYRQGMSSGYGGDYRQGSGSAAYGQNYSGTGEGQQMEHRDVTQGEQRNFTPPGQTGTNQGRY